MLNLKRSAPGKVNFRNVDLTNMGFESDSIDCITSISVIEHIPNVEKAISEMYRCLRVGGKLYLTTDSTPTPTAYHQGVRFFSPDELSCIFKDYPVTSPFEDPDFSEENWCYEKNTPLVTCFVEITKE